MSSIKITDLPNGPWREYALEAQRRGLEKISDCRLSGTDVILIGGALTALYWLPTLLVGWWLF